MMMNAVIFTFLFINNIQCIAWTPEYIDAVLESRSCFNESYMSLIESLFDYIPDIKLKNMYYAKGLSFLGQKLHRNDELCQSIVDTMTYVYRDIITWDKEETLNFQYNLFKKGVNAESVSMKNEQRNKKVINGNYNRYENTLNDLQTIREKTIQHILSLLGNNKALIACKKIGNNVIQQQYGLSNPLHELRRCMREKRKSALWKYAQFKTY